jgi:hypothetical protein
VLILIIWWTAESPFVGRVRGCFPGRKGRGTRRSWGISQADGDQHIVNMKRGRGNVGLGGRRRKCPRAKTFPDSISLGYI